MAVETDLNHSQEDIDMRKLVGWFNEQTPAGKRHLMTYLLTLLAMVSIFMYAYLVIKPAERAERQRAAQIQTVRADEDLQSIRDTGPMGRRFIVPLWHRKIAIAGEPVEDCELYKNFEWEMRSDGTFVVYRRVRSAMPGNVFYDRRAIMERQLKPYTVS